jgi:O-acetyl-ADP-ribose deacetylase (regulator of RNase III)
MSSVESVPAIPSFSPRPLLPVIDGNLLHVNTTFIAHQCNCQTSRAKGLAHTIFRKFPHTNTYASGSTRHVGTIDVFSAPTLHEGPGVINMYAQRSPGRAGREHETASHRAHWFRRCLQAMALLRAESIAFPCYIGCALAGGEWHRYHRMITTFARQNPTTRVIIVKLAGAHE